MRVRKTGQNPEFTAFRAEFQNFANSGQSSLKTNAREETGHPASDALGKRHNHALCRILARTLLQNLCEYGFCQVPDARQYGLGPALNGLEPCTARIL